MILVAMNPNAVFCFSRVSLTLAGVLTGAGGGETVVQGMKIKETNLINYHS